MGIGKAIIHAPRVLLLDEPASGRDPESRSALAQVFKALQAQGMSLLVSSHILAELDEYSSHMLALDQGKVLEHRALQATSVTETGQGAERRLRLEFVELAKTVAPWLRGQWNVRLYRAEEQTLEIGFTGTLSEQSALIAACVASDYHLTSIAAVSENLQQSYLKSLAASRATNATNTTNSSHRSAP